MRGEGGGGITLAFLPAGCLLRFSLFQDWLCSFLLVERSLSWFFGIAFHACQALTHGLLGT